MRKEDFTQEQLKVLDHLIKDFEEGLLRLYTNPQEVKEVLFENELDPSILDMEQKDEVVQMIMKDIENFKKDYDLDTCDPCVIGGLRAHLGNYVLGDEPKEFSEIYIMVENAYFKIKNHD